MNANASPLRTKDAERVLPDAGMILLAEKLDQGFDSLVAHHATHRIRDAKVIHGIRDDLAQLIIYPEVTFAATLPDGTMVLCCPDALPSGLVGIAEPLEMTDKMPPLPGHRRAGLGSKLERLEQKLDDLLNDRVDSERLSDRVEAMEFALGEGLGRAEMVEVNKALATISQRLESLVRPDLDMTPVMDGLERTLNAVTGLEQRPDPLTLLHGLDAKLQALVNRPAVQPDLTLQRLGFANFLTSMSTVVKRMEGAVDKIAVPDLAPPLDARLLRLEEQTQAIATALPDLRPNLAPLTDQMGSLHLEFGRLAGIASAVVQLTASVDALANRPDPVLNLTQQRQSFASFATAMGSAIRRLEDVAQAFQSQPDSAATLAAIDNLRQILTQTQRADAGETSAVQHLAARVDDLAARAAPVLDLGALRHSLAGFSAALTEVVDRIEQIEDRAAPSPQPPSEAMTLPSPPSPVAPGDLPENKKFGQSMATAPQAFEQALRYSMAEALALQIKALAGKD